MGKGRWLVALGVAFLACGGGDDSDGGLDAGMDATLNDSGIDSGKDSGDATTDAASDVMVDVAADVAENDASDGGSAVDASDAGSSADVSDAAVDAGLDDAGCGAKTSFAFSSDAGCGIGVDYTCGSDTYEIECKCSPGLCGCKKNDGGLGFLMNYGGCPACSITPSYTTLATGCGIPY
jgi:hypothetical protein